MLHLFSGRCRLIQVFCRMRPQEFDGSFRVWGRQTHVIKIVIAHDGSGGTCHAHVHHDTAGAEILRSAVNKIANKGGHALLVDPGAVALGVVHPAQQ
jgi:hypothetical protein